ncbi:hypothetical protein DMJ13_26660 [halophilic archaeon]|nr:hypothetical protein DMJ13_26660 [halophilic archaeon]
MPGSIDAEQIQQWIDDELVENIEQVPDNAAEFNFAIEMSNILVHVVQRQSDGPVIIGQQIEYSEDIRSRIQNLSEADRNDLVARIRELLTEVPVIYGFHNQNGENVIFKDMSQIFLEYRIYPDGLSQHSLMTGLVDVWKAMRYLDDIVTLIDSVENKRV